MPEEGKNKVNLILLILLVVSLALNLNALLNAGKRKGNLESEKQQRLKLQEQSNNLELEKDALTKERDAFKGQIESLDKALEKERAEHRVTRENLQGTEALCKNSEDKLEKCRRLEGILEKELKSSLLEKEKAAKKKK